MVSSELHALRQGRAAAAAGAAQSPPARSAAPPATGEAPTTAEAASATGRSPDAVDAALAAAPGLPDSPSQWMPLRKALIRGDCTPQALARIQKPVNRQTLLALMSRLEGC